MATSPDLDTNMGEDAVRTITGNGFPGAYTINYVAARTRNLGSVTVNPSAGHRTDGPCHVGVYPSDVSDHLIIYWARQDVDHRLNGPACTMSDGDLYWTVEGDDVAHVSDPEGGDHH